MNNISFTDIYYPLMTDPRYKMLCTIQRPLTEMMYYAKKHQTGESEFAWENMHDAYHELIGTVKAFEAIGIMEANDRFRIPFIAYRTALKIATRM